MTAEINEETYKRIDELLKPYIPNDAFRARSVKEIELANIYIATCNHGTSGHLSLTVIDALARLVMKNEDIS